MTDSAELNQLRHTVSLQGATIGRHEELLLDLLEGLRSLTERHDQAIMEQIRELAHRWSTNTENPQPLRNYFPVSGEFVQPTPAP